MKTFTYSILVTLLLVIAAPAWSDSVVYIQSCYQDEDTSDDELEAMAAEWLKAAKELKVAENMKIYMNFPVAAKAGEVDLQMVMVSPTFAEWGTFTDNYSGSAAEAIDDKYEDEVDCSDGALWESLEVKLADSQSDS